MHDENMRTYLKNKNTLLLRYALILRPHKRYVTQLSTRGSLLKSRSGTKTVEPLTV